MDLSDVWGLGSALPGGWSRGEQLSSLLVWWEAGAGISVMGMWGLEKDPGDSQAWVDLERARSDALVRDFVSEGLYGKSFLWCL